MPDTGSHFMYVRNYIESETALSHRVLYITSRTTLSIWLNSVWIIMHISYIRLNGYLWKELTMPLELRLLLICIDLALPETVVKQKWEDWMVHLSVLIDPTISSKRPVWDNFKYKLWFVIYNSPPPSHMA